MQRASAHAGADPYEVLERLKPVATRLAEECGSLGMVQDSSSKAHPSPFSPLGDGLCDEHRDHAIGFVLVLLIRRVCCGCDTPESLSLD